MGGRLGRFKSTGSRMAAVVQLGLALALRVPGKSWKISILILG
jgi:hypothetical protein